MSMSLTVYNQHKVNVANAHAQHSIRPFPKAYGSFTTN